MYEGDTWRFIGMPGDGHTGLLIQLSCGTPSLCVVDADQDIRGFNGRAWSTRLLGSGDTVAALACAPAMCLASTKNVDRGYDHTLLTRNGSSWTEVANMPEPIATNQIVRSCPTPTFCMDAFNVSPSGGSFTLFDGTRWTPPQPIPGLSSSSAAGTLTAMACPSSRRCLVLGQRGHVLEYRR